MTKTDLTLYEFSSQLLDASGSLRDTLGVVIGHGITQFQAQAADVLFYDAPARALRYMLGRGFKTGTFEKATRRAEILARPVVNDARARHVRDLHIFEEELMNTGWVQEGFVSYVGAPLICNDQVEGVLELFSRYELPVNSEWMRQLERTTEKAARALHVAIETRRIEQAQLGLTQNFDAMIAVMVHALELREQESTGHTERVAELTAQFARAYGFTEAEIVNVRRGALLHDIGKMGVPESVLHKPESLTEDEWALMRQHPEIAHDMLAPIEFLRPTLAIPYCHHEKWDGTGYPRGLKGEDIPLAARLFAVVDVWDALRSPRAYRQPWPDEKILKHIVDRGGRHFEQRLAEMFVKLVQAGKLQRQRPIGERDYSRNYTTQTINT
jgi:putative nucleotidyltransferase with HDIG domain